MLSILPQLDKENSTDASSLGTENVDGRFGKMFGPGLSKPLSLHKTLSNAGILSLTTPRRAMGDVGNTLTQQRTAPMTGKKDYIMETKEKSPFYDSETNMKKDTKIGKSVKDVEKNLLEPEILPVIPDTEDDFEDILPSSERLQPLDVHHLLNFWEKCQKPVIDLPRNHSPFQVPSLDFCPLWESEDIPNVTLEPELDDLIFIPPPWE